MICKPFFLTGYFIVKLIISLLLLISCLKTQGQLCNGSLGDPVVNITFGAGNNFGPPLSAAATNYKYIPNACPENGYYTLLNKGLQCNYGWHVLQSDHTGNPGGYLMLVDASFDPSDFYVDTVRSLCANTTYEFAAWMLNMKYVSQGIKPNITFSIETENGTVLKTYNSGDIPVEQTIVWKQYGFYFTTPQDVSSIVLRLKNNAPGGDGNDLALDDITFRPCGKLITASIDGSTGNTVDICEGITDIYNYSAKVASGYQSPVFQWQLSTDKAATWVDIVGANAITYKRTPTAAGVYWYRLTVVEANAANQKTCRIATNEIVINVHPTPIVDAGPDRQLLRGSTTNIFAKATGEELTYTWTPNNYINDNTLLTPIVSPVDDSKYFFTAKSKYGCTNLDEVLIKVVTGIFIPSAFTPNGDGKNDNWKIPYLDTSNDATVNVFNRFGQLVYQEVGQAVSWDGTFKGEKQPAGTYVYFVKFMQGNFQMKGTVNLIR
jgi:gliding motility-associated-like protein